MLLLEYGRWVFFIWNFVIHKLNAHSFIICLHLLNHTVLAEPTLAQVNVLAYYAFS